MKMAVKTMSPLAASVARAQITTPKNICCSTRTSSSVMSSNSPFSGPAEDAQGKRLNQQFWEAVNNRRHLAATSAYQEAYFQHKCFLFWWIHQHNHSERILPHWYRPHWVLGMLSHVRYIHLYLCDETKKMFQKSIKKERCGKKSTLNIQ